MKSKISKPWQFQKLKELYLDKKWSINKISNSSKELLGEYVGNYAIHKALKKIGIDIRGIAESVSNARSNLNITESFETEAMVEWIDGFNLGDGYIAFNNTNNCAWQGARYVIGTVEKEWCEYAIKGLNAYQPSIPKQYGKIRDNSPRLAWSSRTLTHPDIIKQAQRWYPDGKKKVPLDVRITPTSLLLWYLGDGSITKSGISYTVRFATCSFDPNDIDNILIPKMNLLGLNVWRDKCGKNDIKMATKSTSLFFDIIGKKSPISCYNYKFEFHQWLTLKRLSDIVPNKREKWRVQYMFKQGKLDCTLSPGGKMILFTPEQEEKLLISLNKHKPHHEYKGGEVLKYKKDIDTLSPSSNCRSISLSDIVKTSMERWNARYFITTEKVESLNGSKFTPEQAKVLRDKLNQYGDQLAIPEKDINRYVKEARSWGFPYYDISKEKFIKGMLSLKNARIEKKDGMYTWAGHGSSLASFFHPHMFECRSKGKISSVELFNSNEDFRRAIWKAIALYGKITKSNVREICRNEKVSSRINQFPPRVAMSVLKELYPDGNIKYLDPTHGFSGRLIGAYASGLVNKYVGIDLSFETHKGANKTVEWMNGVPDFNMEVDLINGDCLVEIPRLNDDFDLVFTSPPFLDVEQYKGVPFETDYKEWLEDFICSFCSLSYECLRAGGKLAVYLEKINNYNFRDDFRKIAIQNGFCQCDSILFKASYSENNRNKKTHRGIPILIFEK